MSQGLGFLELVRALERRLVRELGLVPLALPDSLDRLSGVFRGQPARLEARAYTGPSVRYARFVELASDPRDGQLEIGNAAVVPRPELPLPLFGADLVGLGRDTAVVVADLSPILDDAAAGAELHASLLRHGAGHALEFEARAELLAWAAEWFSSDALSVRVRPEQSPAAARAVERFAAAFLELAARARPASGSGAAERAVAASKRQEAYSAAHREHDRGLLLLRRIFEPTVADRFLREVLFPERLPA